MNQSAAEEFIENNAKEDTAVEPEELLTITVHCSEGPCVHGKHMAVAMIPFTGEASGPYFQGRITGTGTDTQKIGKDGSLRLSARYMLEGRDHTGKDCHIFIENNGSSMDHCIPAVVTDSDALSSWEEETLFSRVESLGDGVKVHIYRGAE